MKNRIVRDLAGWGFGLWLFGYLLGFVFYGFVPPAIIGWYVMPIGVIVTCIVLWRFSELDTFADGVWLGLAWAAIAVVFDYLFIVKLLDPPDGYYKPDVYIYYLLTFLLPVGAALLKRAKA